MLYSFQGGGDGTAPDILVRGEAGIIYGISPYGGTGSCGATTTTPAGCGTVFALSPNVASATGWNEAVLHSFGDANSSDGSEPTWLAAGKGGSLVGTTYSGGTGACASTATSTSPSTSGCGTLFQLTPPGLPAGEWSETLLYDFKGTTADTENPVGQFVIDKHGNVYGIGANASGTVPGYGAVYELIRPAHKNGAWTESNIYDFPHPANPFALPFGGLVTDASGAFYGEMLFGPSNTSSGSVFEIIPP